MDEEKYDSSKVEYNEIETKKFKKVEDQWKMAVGLQKVDNLTPSKYLEDLINENVNGRKDIYQIEKELEEYYIERKRKKDINLKELECDIVSSKIVEILQDDVFELSLDYMRDIHQKLFKDIYDFAGNFRTVNFSKKEKILNGNSVAYGDYKTIKESLEYDISLEKEKDYKKMTIPEVINNITKFSSSIWQVHPFREGNTRTTAVFIEKYLISLGYNVDNSLFKEKSVYFRNALVRSNYFNNSLDIEENNSYLIKFYENLLLGKNNNLHSKDLIIEELFL